MRSSELEKKMRKNVEKMRKMRQNMRRKMLFSCNGVCLPQTPMFVKTHIDLLTPPLFSRDYTLVQVQGHTKMFPLEPLRDRP